MNLFDHFAIISLEPVEQKSRFDPIVKAKTTYHFPAPGITEVCTVWSYDLYKLFSCTPYSLQSSDVLLDNCYFQTVDCCFENNTDIFIVYVRMNV